MVAGLVPWTGGSFRLRLEAAPAGDPGRVAGGAGGVAGDPGREAGDPGRVAGDPGGPWDSAGAYALRAGALRGLEPVPSTLAGALLGPLLERGALAGLPFGGPVADAGTLHRLLAASAGLLARCWPYDLPPGVLLTSPRPGHLGGPVLVADGAALHPAATVAGPAVLDRGSRVAVGAVVTRAILGPGAAVGAGARVVGSVLGPGASLDPGEVAVAALLPGPPPLG
jgi:NDP-sugar pyrophosphorylase family protein